MPCSCTAGLCSTCACGRSGARCGAGCHGARASEGDAFLSCNAACLNFPEAVALGGVPLADIRRTLARQGSDVIGSANELKRRLADNGLQLVLHNLPAGDWDAGDRGTACHPDRVEEFRAGKDKAFNALVGQVMKASKGKANPQQVTDLLRARLG